MIIECPKCATKFRFDQNKIEEEGIWAKCSRCQHVFFYSVPGSAPGSKTDQKDCFGGDAIGTSADPYEYEGNAARNLADFPESETVYENKKRTGLDLWTPGKITAYIIVLFITLSGASLSVFPEFRSYLADTIRPVARLLGFQIVTGELNGGGIDLLNVRERFVENKLVGNIMVIQGYAVNRNKFPVSKIKVRARLLNPAGEFTAESESYCGVLLTEEELANLTQAEMRLELNKSFGRDVTNSAIPQDGNIPFFIVFFDAPPKTVEYIVELAEMNKP